MTTPNTPIPDSMRPFTEKQTQSTVFDTEQQLEALLLEGLESGPPEPLKQEDWKDIERQIRRRVRQRKERTE